MASARNVKPSKRARWRKAAKKISPVTAPNTILLSDLPIRIIQVIWVESQILELPFVCKDLWSKLSHRHARNEFCRKALSGSKIRDSAFYTYLLATGLVTAENLGNYDGRYLPFELFSEGVRIPIQALIPPSAESSPKAGLLEDLLWHRAKVDWTASHVFYIARAAIEKSILRRRPYHL